MVTWRILITATEDGGCRLDVSAINGDHWRDVRALITTTLAELGEKGT
jgi:hypothetical protein